MAYAAARVSSIIPIPYTSYYCSYATPPQLRLPVVNIKQNQVPTFASSFPVRPISSGKTTISCAYKPSAFFSPTSLPLFLLGKSIFSKEKKKLKKKKLKCYTRIPSSPLTIPLLTTISLVQSSPDKHTQTVPTRPLHAIPFHPLVHPEPTESTTNTDIPLPIKSTKKTSPPKHRKFPTNASAFTFLSLLDTAYCTPASIFLSFYLSFFLGLSSVSSSPSFHRHLRSHPTCRCMYS